MSASLESAAAMWWTALDAAESAIRAADRELTADERRELTGRLSARRPDRRDDRRRHHRHGASAREAGARHAARRVRRLGVEPEHAAAFETSVAGVAAARDGGFKLVIAVDEAGRAAELRERGAHLVGRVSPSCSSEIWQPDGMGAVVEARRVGLPAAVRACLFDLDGVLTDTASTHATAWKAMFDAYLRERATRAGTPFVPFDPVADYTAYVDGKPRYDGVRSFLLSRGIELPEGDAGDAPGAETIRGLGDRKNVLVLELIAERGVKTYEGSIRYVHEARDAGLRCAVVSSSTNCREVLVAAGILDLFEVIVDGLFVRREGLRGKPAPDGFLAAARELGLAPAESAVFEDALAGVEAGRAGSFAYVVGVDRAGQAEALREHGADVVVSDLAELLP